MGMSNPMGGEEKIRFKMSLILLHRPIRNTWRSSMTEHSSKGQRSCSLSIQYYYDGWYWYHAFEFRNRFTLTLFIFKKSNVFRAIHHAHKNTSSKNCMRYHHLLWLSHQLRWQSQPESLFFVCHPTILRNSVVTYSPTFTPTPPFFIPYVVCKLKVWKPHPTSLFITVVLLKVSITSLTMHFYLS